MIFYVSNELKLSKLRMMITHLFTKVSDEQRNFVTHLQETWKFFKASIVIGFQSVRVLWQSTALDFYNIHFTDGKILQLFKNCRLFLLRTNFCFSELSRIYFGCGYSAFHNLSRTYLSLSLIEQHITLTLLKFRLLLNQIAT